MTDEPTVMEEPIAETLSRLVHDGRELVAAEIGVYKARVSERVSRYRAAAILFAAAGVLALTALIALLVGAILTLATRIGPGFATLTVVGGVLVLAAILALVGKARLSPPVPVEQDS